MRLLPAIAVCAATLIAGCSSSSDAPDALAAADGPPESAEETSASDLPGAADPTADEPVTTAPTTTTTSAVPPTSDAPLEIRFESADGLNLLPATVERCMAQQLSGQSETFTAIANSSGFASLDYSVQAEVATAALSCTSVRGLNAGYSTNVVTALSSDPLTDEYATCVNSHLASGSGIDVMIGLIIRSELVPPNGAPRSAVAAMANDCVDSQLLVSVLIQFPELSTDYDTACVDSAIATSTPDLAAQLIEDSLSNPTGVDVVSISAESFAHCIITEAPTDTVTPTP